MYIHTCTYSYTYAYIHRRNGNDNNHNQISIQTYHMYHTDIYKHISIYLYTYIYVYTNTPPRKHACSKIPSAAAPNLRRFRGAGASVFVPALGCRHRQWAHSTIAASVHETGIYVHICTGAYYLFIYIFIFIYFLHIYTNISIYLYGPVIMKAMFGTVPGNLGSDFGGPPSGSLH